MDESEKIAGGTGLATMVLHQAVFELLISRRIASPAVVAEVLDAVVLTLEQQRGAENRTTPASDYARDQVRTLIEVLEAAHPEMRRGAFKEDNP